MIFGKSTLWISNNLRKIEISILRTKSGQNQSQKSEKMMRKKTFLKFYRFLGMKEVRKMKWTRFSFEKSDILGLFKCFQLITYQFQNINK